MKNNNLSITIGVIKLAKAHSRERIKLRLNTLKRNFYSYFGLFIFSLCSYSITMAQELPVPQRYVEDRANIVTDTAERSLNGYLQELEQKTGVQMIILTINTTGDIPIETYAIKLATKWQLGQKGKDNGVLVVIAKDDHAYRVEVGYGLESILPDNFCGKVGRTYFAPNFQKGQFSEGIFQATIVIVHKIAEDNGVKIIGIPLLDPDKAEKERLEIAAQKAEEEKRRAEVRKRRDEFVKKNGVEEWPDISELAANPFVYEGKIIAIQAGFKTMQTATQGVFVVGKGAFFVVSDIPKGMFKNTGSIVLAGRVLGKTDLQIPLFGLMQVPHLKFVGVHFCQDNDCNDIIQ